MRYLTRPQLVSLISRAYLSCDRHLCNNANRNYKALMAELTPARKKQLQTAQRLWLQYRDANCHFYADPDGGTAAGVAAADCVLQMTAHRARELADLR